MSRAIWKGAISFSLIHIPVSLHTASRPSAIDLDMLDKHDFSPVGYQRINKNTGKSEGLPEIVSRGFVSGDNSGILQEAHVNQLRVPDDLSLVGFDDTFASYLTPPLTTVRQPMEALGRAAVRLAMTSRESAAVTPQRERLTTQLIVRESTAPPA